MPHAPSATLGLPRYRIDLRRPAKQKAKTLSFSHSIPRPPQAPAAPFKRAYRKCRLAPHRLITFRQAALPISPNVFRQVDAGQPKPEY